MAFIRRYDRTKPVKKEDPINENIRFKEVLVIDQNGEQLGVMSKRDAMNRAYDAGLDLVCVAPKAKPAEETKRNEEEFKSCCDQGDAVISNNRCTR